MAPAAKDSALVADETPAVDPPVVDAPVAEQPVEQPGEITVVDPPLEASDPADVKPGDSVVVTGDVIHIVEDTDNADPQQQPGWGSRAVSETIVTPQTDMPSGTQDSGLRSADEPEYDHGPRFL